MCFKELHFRTTIWDKRFWLIERYRNGNRYLDVLELNLSFIERAAANRSYRNFSLRSSGLSNVNVDNKNFILSRDIVKLNIESFALSENKMLKL